MTSASPRPFVDLRAIAPLIGQSGDRFAIEIAKGEYLIKARLAFRVFEGEKGIS